MGFESVCFNFPDCSAVLLIFVSVLLQYSECGERERGGGLPKHTSNKYTPSHTRYYCYNFGSAGGLRESCTRLTLALVSRRNLSSSTSSSHVFEAARSRSKASTPSPTHLHTARCPRVSHPAATATTAAVAAGHGWKAPRYYFKTC